MTKETKPAAIRIFGKNTVLSNVSFSGHSRPIQIEPSGSAYLHNVSASPPIQKKKPLRSSKSSPASTVGWTSEITDRFDPKIAASKADPFSSPRRMLEWGKRHIDTLQSEIESFMQDKPWTHVVEENDSGVAELHKIKFNARLSETLPNIIFDAANNLRPVLDQAGYACAILRGATTPKSCKFPFGPTETDMANNARGGCKDLPPEITALFTSFCPYEGGNGALWALNELCNTPKHKFLEPVPLGLEGLLLQINEGVMAGRVIIDAPVWDAEKNEIVMFESAFVAQIQYDTNLTISVAFNNELQTIGSHEPIGVLRTIAGEVESVLMATEAECCRIGLI